MSNKNDGSIEWSRTHSDPDYDSADEHPDDQQPQPPQPEAPERIWVSPLIQLTGRLNYEYYIGSTNWSGDCVQYIRADLAAERPAKKVRPLSACCAAEVIDTTVCSKCRTFHADYAVAERPADEDERVKAAAQEIHDWIFEPPDTWPIRGEATIRQITAILHRLLDRQQVQDERHATTKPSV